MPDSSVLRRAHQEAGERLPVEAISGRHLHKQNFRRLVETAALVEPTGETSTATGGRPAAQFRFRREVVQERPAPGLRLGGRVDSPRTLNLCRRSAATNDGAACGLRLSALSTAVQLGVEFGFAGALMEFFFCSAWCCWRFRSSPSWRWSRPININDRLRAIERASPRLNRGWPVRRARRRAGQPAAIAQSSPAGARPRGRAAAAEPPPAPPPPPATEAGSARAAAAEAEPERVVSFEEKFGTRWTVWIGGVALALGGIFLVKYSIEAGLIGPGLRLFFGALLAAALVAARRMDAPARSRSPASPRLPAADIPSILTAAGTTVAYATVYAAYGLYGFLDPAFAFVLLGAVALATLGAALLHGPALAALGLVGAFVTPMLVASAAPNYWALYIYLAVVTAAAFALALMRLWQWLALIAVAFGFFWLLPGIHDSGVDALAAHLFHVVAGYALSAALIVAGLFYGPSSEPGKIDPLSVDRALGLSHRRAHPGAGEPARPGGAHRLHRCSRSPPSPSPGARDAAAGAVPVAAMLASIVILRWALAPEIAHLIAPAGRRRRSRAAAVARRHRRRISGSASASRRCSAPAASWRRAARDRRSSRSCGAPPGSRRRSLILIALYYRIAGFERSIPFAGLALLLAALNGFATETLGKRDAASGPRRLRRALRHRHGRGAGAGADLLAGKRLAHGRARPDGAGHRLDRLAAPVPDAALACRRRVRAGGGAGRLGAAHRRQRRRHDADLQLDPLRLRRAGDLVLGRGLSAAQARRRHAVAHGRQRRDPVHGADRASSKSAIS